MLQAVLSMVFGAGGAVLVAGIGCMAVFQMALSVSEQAGRIHKYDTTKEAASHANDANVKR